MDYYKPKNKKEREARRRVWDRFVAMRDDPLRKEAEEQWELGDKAFMQWMPEKELDDWRANLSLPDAFSGVQTYAQESIDRRSRPKLQSVESSDLAIEMFNNAIMKYSMDRTGFDYQEYLAKQAAAIRGTSWVFEFYRYEKRKVQDPTGVNEDGSLKYTDKEIIDADDTYTTFVENERAYIDPSATHISNARDQIYEEIIDWNEFQRVYGQKSDFINVKLVPKCGDMRTRTEFFQKPHDATDNDVQILHYYNRSTDSYDALANNVLIRLGPIPYKHKELPGTPRAFYNVPGRIWGMGIPKIIYSLTEERKSLRNLAVDRQNMQINKMFLVNDLVDLDDEDFRTRPGGFIPVNTNGLSINNVITPVEYGDIPMSYYKAEDMLLEDIRRAHGIDDRLQGVPQGGTATEAAMMQQASQRRIALVNSLMEMDALVRIGRLKWSNIQFFYPAPRIERITEDNNTREKKVYRHIKVDGQEFEILKNDGNLELNMSDIDGSSGFRLDKTHASFMQGDYDVTVAVEPETLMSKPIRQAKMTEMFNLLLLNPAAASTLDIPSAVKRYIKVNDEDPKNWMRSNGMTEADWYQLAVDENKVMSQGQILSPTPSAPESHTNEHLNYMNSQEFDDLVEKNPAIKTIFEQHVFGEHQNNPNTGNLAELMQGGQVASGGPAAPTAPQGGAPTEIQPADIQPSTVGGTDRQDAKQEALQA
ncbi:MAG TPA: hypothetical protein VFL85_01555 [Candidatus Saccharimonadales bacterium]|nr:hypothetical protein [Candidatus Saccharimonadales bacterium]